MPVPERVGKSAENLGKKLLLFFARFFIRQSPSSIFDGTQCRRILVVRQDNRLGNLILIEPLLRALRQHFPQAHLTLVVGEAFADLYVPGVLIDEVIVFPQFKLAKNPLGLFRWLRDLRHHPWDLAIDSAHPRTISVTNLLLAGASRARWRLGFARHGSERFLNLTIPAPSPRSYIEEQLFLLRPLGIMAGVSAPLLGLPPGHETIAKQFRQILKVSEEEHLCGLWIGGRRDKCWPLDEFLKLYRRFDDEMPRRFSPVLLSGPAENVSVDSGFRHHRFNGPIWEFGACLKTLDWFLSVDSGPRHFAVALGVPSIGLFRGGAQAEYGHEDGRTHFDFSMDHEQDLLSKLLRAVDIIWNETMRRNSKPASLSETLDV
jgi:ADP-heptose:LPS heptosyltransferase